MKTMTVLALSITVLLLIFLMVSLPVSAAPPAWISTGLNSHSEGKQRDDRIDPLSKQQRLLRKKGKIAELKAKAYGRSRQVARGQFVELERQGEDSIWTVLGEFSDYPHNSIVEPDRTINNTTIWTPDFNRDYYLEMLFAEGPGANSMRNYLIE
jgi:immune inhibitor A